MNGRESVMDLKTLNRRRSVVVQLSRLFTGVRVTFSWRKGQCLVLIEINLTEHSWSLS